MGRKSHADEHGAQGTLAKRRKQLAESDLHKMLAENQTHEAMRLAREYTPGAVKRLNQLIHAKGTADSARVTAIRVMHEMGYPKTAGKGPIGGTPTKLEVTINNFDGTGERLEATAMPVKVLPDVSDAELDE